MQQDRRNRPSIEIVPDAPTDPDAFLRWSAKRPREEGRYELSRGVVTRTMINVTRHHNQICTNLILELGRCIDLESYDIGSADFGIRTPAGVRGPDLFVLPIGTDGKALSADNPVFLAEVLSPSSESIDFNDKREEYGAIPSLQTYVIFSQEEPRAWVFARQPSGRWPKRAKVVEGRQAAIRLAGLAATLVMAAIYRGIPDPA